MTIEQVLPKLPPRPDTRAPTGRPDVVLSPAARTSARILVVDEKGIMRDALIALLNCSKEFEIVGAESSSADALRTATSTHPDLLILDFSPTLNTGPELIAALKARHPGIRVLVLTFRREGYIVDAALRAGADGYLLKNDNCADLFAALRDITAGKNYLSPSIVDPTAGSSAGRSRKGSRGFIRVAGVLTDRERQVMRLIAAGRRTREIARLLSLSHKTIEKHRTSLMRKLGLRNASAVAAYAIAHGIGDV